MHQYKTIIIDDEAHSRELLQEYLSKYTPEIGVCETAKNINEAYEKILIHKPEIIFLDIRQLPSTQFSQTKISHPEKM